jgi:hypothetical protein
MKGGIHIYVHMVLRLSVKNNVAESQNVKRNYVELIKMPTFITSRRRTVA